MKTKKYNRGKHLDFLILDLLCLEAAYLTAILIRHGGFPAYLPRGLYVNVNALMLIIDVCYVLVTNEHHNILKRSVSKEISSVILNNLLIWAFIGVYQFITKQGELFSRDIYLRSFGLSVIFMIAVRLIWKQIIRKRVQNGAQLPNLLLVSTCERAKEVLENIQKRQYNGFTVIGVALVDADCPGGEVCGVPVVCNRESIQAYLLEHVVDDVMISLPGVISNRDELIHTIVKAGPRVHISLDYVYDNLPNRTIENVGGYAVLTSWITHATPFQLALKRLVDIVGGIVGCIICGIAFLFVAPAIYKASPGPIFFAQERVGQNGRHFRMYKFRSMYPDAEERKKALMAENEMNSGDGKNLMFKMENDPRVIGSEKGPGKGIGNFIRKTSIDEFPQFLNVLKGDMSLVGTRPPTVDEVEQYDLHHKVRLTMKPGITGMWQVSGRSDITDFEEVMRLDEEYLEKWSLGLDFRILFKTVKVVFEKEGAK